MCTTGHYIIIYYNNNRNNNTITQCGVCVDNDQPQTIGEFNVPRLNQQSPYTLSRSLTCQCLKAALTVTIQPTLQK